VTGNWRLRLCLKQARDPLGITSAFWAIIAGLVASLCVERRQLLDFWAGK
jgi:hypothetical protein